MIIFLWLQPGHFHSYFYPFGLIESICQRSWYSQFNNIPVKWSDLKALEHITVIILNRLNKVIRSNFFVFIYSRTLKRRFGRFPKQTPTSKYFFVSVNYYHECCLSPLPYCSIHSLWFCCIWISMPLSSSQQHENVNCYNCWYSKPCY